MALELFPYTPSPGVRTTSSPRVKDSVMGDGYVQSKKDGLNSDLKEYSVEFILEPNHADIAKSFLSSRYGVISFLFYSPERKKEVTVKCKKWNTETHHFFVKITATFSETVL